MNLVFNFQRFRRYFSKEFFEKRLLLFGIIVFVSIVINFIYSTLDGNSHSEGPQEISLFLCLIITPAIFINLVLNQFPTKTKSLNTLTLPVSFFERWLFVVLIVFFIYFPLVLIILKTIDLFYITHLREVGLTKYKLTKMEIDEYLKVIDFSFINSKIFFGHFVKFSLSVSAISLLGTLYFRKYSIVLTLLMIIVCLAFMTFFRQYLFESIIEKGAYSRIVDISSVDIRSEVPYQFYHVSAVKPIANFSNIFMSIVLPIILWVAALLGFKEKEI